MSLSTSEIIITIYCSAVMLTTLAVAAYLIAKCVTDANRPANHPPPDSIAPDLESGPPDSFRQPDPVQEVVRLQASPQQQCRRMLRDYNVVTISYGTYCEISEPEDGGAGRSGRSMCGECVVCLSEFEAEDECILLGKCSHVFHRRCAEAWLKEEPSCPVCRARVAFRFGCSSSVRFGSDIDLDSIA